MPVSRAIAAAIHDVEPATYGRCTLIRDWLGHLGVRSPALGPDRPRHVRAVESVLRRAAKRTAVTYGDLC